MPTKQKKDGKLKWILIILLLLVVGFIIYLIGWQHGHNALFEALCSGELSLGC